MHSTLKPDTNHIRQLNNQRNFPAIKVQARPGRVPLSFSQEQLWFIDRLQSHTQYHIPAVLRLRGKLDKSALSNALHQIVSRHEVLRTVIREEEGARYQHIKAADGWQLQMVDGSKYRECFTDLQQYIKDYVETAFNLSDDYMLRAVLINIEAEDHILVATLHHIASDGWSAAIVITELAELYHAYANQLTHSLLPLAVQYADYTIWQHSYLQGKAWSRKLAYWKGKLQGVTPLQLPTDYPRPLIQTTSGAVTGILVDQLLTDQLKAFSRQQDATLFMTLLSTLNVLLYRYSGQPDICVGTFTTGRQQQELKKLVGSFINTLALRNEVDGSASFTTLLQQVKINTLESYQHQEIPFEKVVATVVDEPDISLNPLFQVMLVLQNTPEVEQLQVGGLELSRGLEGLYVNTISKYDITFHITDTGKGLYLSAKYCTDLYKEATIHRMMAHYEKLLHSVIKAPGQSIGNLPMLCEAEESRLLSGFNQTTVAYPTDKSIISLFEDQVLTSPEKISAIFEGNEISYQELNTRANQLAHYLRSKGVNEETLVPVCIERSIEMLVGIVGILKAGAAYVPIDPDYPLERIRYMLTDTCATIIVSSKQSRTVLSGNDDVDIIEIDGDRSYLHQQPSGNLDIAIHPRHLAYVIYTSGSTGKPKGVMVEHTSVVNLLKSVAATVQFHSGSGFLSVTTYSFDIAYLELYLPLITGGKLIIVPKEVAMDGFKLAGYVSVHRPTHMQGTPSTWQLLLDADWKNNEGITMLIGGEAIKEAMKESLTKRGDVFNCYGPTETTIWSAMKKLAATEKVVIGKPIANTKMVIVNRQGALCPINVVGEIYIGGVGLARGYFNRPELTAEKFIKNYFSNEAGERLYRTGDSGFWLADGNIECLGRIDDQVKIRGYRIELGEIENTLLQSGLAAQAAVVAREDKYGDKQLVGYIVPQEAFNKAEISNFLHDKLPAYMVPQLLIEISSLPLTPNGKVDKKALPDPDLERTVSHGYTAPRTDMETALATIWQELFGEERIGIHDDFFSLGGHSLQAMRLASFIRKRLQLEVTIQSLFQCTTIATLAAHLQTRDADVSLPAVEALTRPAHIPLSFSQERLWFIDRLQGSVQYHIPVVLRIKGDLNKAALSDTLQQIVARHEVLRTIIREKEGCGYQYIKEANGWKLQTIDGSIFKDDAPGLQRLISNSIQAPFDLSADYMLRALLVSLDKEEHLLVFTFHHIAYDGWSEDILFNELAELYKSYTDGKEAMLPKMPVQYADYAIWQHTHPQKKAWDKKLGYWKEKLEGTPLLQLPADYSRPPVQSTNGAAIGLKLDKTLSDRLQVFSRQQDATLFMTLLSVVKVLLYRHSGQQDICIGTPTAGRQQQEVEGLIGFFINTLALRSQLDENTSFAGLLQQVKATTLEAYDHQEIPFEKVVEAVVKEREVSYSPLFQVMLVLQNKPDIAQLDFGKLQLSDGSIGLPSHTTAKFDLLFNIDETTQGLILTVEYCIDLYKKQTIERMMAHFVVLLHSVIENPDQNIAAIPILSSAEKTQLLVEFNNTSVAYPKDTTITDLFEEQVTKTPKKTAVVFEGKQLTYEELNVKANKLAAYLRKKGVKAETLVPFCMERSLEMIVTVLAILKAGAVYVPVDPEYPAERIRYMLEDTGAGLIISNIGKLSSSATLSNYEIVNIPEDWPLISEESAANQPIMRDADNLAYVLYTSGSTGKPKGVRMPGSGLVNLLHWQQQQFTNKTERRVLQFASLNFDVSFQEIFSTLCFGSELYLINAERRKDVRELLKDIDIYRITHLFIPYIVLKNLAEYTAEILKNRTSIEEIMVAGEQLKLTDDIKALTRNARVRLINQYGPTEAHVVSSYTIEADTEVPDLPPIGKPIHNTSLYILGHQQQPVPVGVAGELYIGGVQVARGYQNLAGLTAERFIADPFGKPEARMYKTGDLARWLPDGNIEYLGRIDGQVKIRGYRIELGEIENLLQQSGLVSQAVVVAKEDRNGNKNLVGYIVPAQAFDRALLLAYLKSKLPDYMVPALWVQMEQLPLNQNGKIDLKALPAPDAGSISAHAYAAPQNETEISLAAIWQELLGIKQAGINDNFFELGGHSLYAIRLVWLIQKKLNVNISVNDIFIYPTIAGLATNITKKALNSGLPDVNIKYLVPIKTTGHKVPLYFVAGGGGTSLKIKQFAAMLDAEQPVYAFQAPIGGKDMKGFPVTIEGIASVFIEEMLIQNPVGPYALSGHCIGGIIAFEMAKQLEAAGKKVHSLAMFDTFVSEHTKQAAGTIKNLFHVPAAVHKSISRFILKTAFQLYLLRKHPRQSILYKIDTFRAMRNRIRRNNFKANYLEYAGLEIFDDSIEVYMNACKNYVLFPYQGKITVFYATDRYFFLDRNNNIGFRKMHLADETKNSWKKYVAGGTLIHEIKGEHSDIFSPMHGEAFARILQKHLDNP